MRITMLEENPNSECQLASLEDRVVSRLSGRIRGFGIQFVNGGIVLTGAVKTFYAKQLAQHCVMELTDLPLIANDIEVE